MQKTKLAIIGSGPAGYTAGIYASRAQLKPLLLAGIQAGGQLMWTTQVENFPGFPQGRDGKLLMADMRVQAEHFGTSIIDSYVTGVDFSAQPFKLWTKLPQVDDPVSFFERAKSAEITQVVSKIRQQEHDIEAQAVIVAGGAVAMTLGVPGEKEFFGKGVSTCAVCDAAFFKEKEVAVIGGGDSAMEDTLALAKFARKITVIHRREQFRASKIMQERVLKNKKITVKWNTQVVKINGNNGVESIEIKNDQNKSENLLVQGVFLAIGHHPMSAIHQDQLAMDAHGYLITRLSHTKSGLEMGLAHVDETKLLAFPSMTSVEGVFAAGDIVDVRYKQAITAAGMGRQAALDAERWLEARG